MELEELRRRLLAFAVVTGDVIECSVLDCSARAKAEDGTWGRCAAAVEAW